ncbi:pentatricopeptide repeat-containing protein, partial [Tanacetum coccineum]
FWHVIPAGGNLFEVRNGSAAFKVDEQNRTCACRMRQLSGVSCPHSIDVIFKINKMAQDYIPDCFRKDAYFKAYHQYITPVGGMTFWPDSSSLANMIAAEILPDAGQCTQIVSLAIDNGSLLLALPVNAPL